MIRYEMKVGYGKNFSKKMYIKVEAVSYSAAWEKAYDRVMEEFPAEDDFIAIEDFRRVA